MKLEFSQNIFGKYSNIKFHENPISGSRVVPCGWTDRQTDMKLFTILPTRIKNRTINNVNRISVLQEHTKVAQTFLIKLNLYVMYSSFQIQSITIISLNYNITNGLADITRAKSL